jgi:hypothetical protein
VFPFWAGSFGIRFRHSRNGKIVRVLTVSACRDPGLQHADRALELYEAVGLVKGQADVSSASGLLFVRRGDIEKSGVVFDRAVELYEAQGLMQEAAWAAVARARARALCRWVGEQVPVEECLGLVVPATLFLDSVRFQFRDAPERIAWSARAGAASALALELAAVSMDPVLVADLVETHINSVVHAPRTSRDEQSPTGTGTRSGPADRLAAARAAGRSGRSRRKR